MASALALAAMAAEPSGPSSPLLAPSMDRSPSLPGVLLLLPMGRPGCWQLASFERRRQPARQTVQGQSRYVEQRAEAAACRRCAEAVLAARRAAVDRLCATTTAEVFTGQFFSTERPGIYNEPHSKPCHSVLRDPLQAGEAAQSRSLHYTQGACWALTCVIELLNSLTS